MTTTTKTRFNNLAAGMVIARPDVHPDAFDQSMRISCGTTARQAERRIEAGDTVTIEAIEMGGRFTDDGHPVRGHRVFVTFNGQAYEATSSMNAWVRA